VILADTSVWIEFLRDNPRYSASFRVHLDHQRIVSVACVFGELLQGAGNRRERDIISSYWDNIPKRSENGLWIEAGILASEGKLLQKGVGLIDAALIVAARREGDLLWTLDKKLKRVVSTSALYHPEESQ